MSVFLEKKKPTKGYKRDVVLGQYLRMICANSLNNTAVLWK